MYWVCIWCQAKLGTRIWTGRWGTYVSGASCCAWWTLLTSLPATLTSNIVAASSLFKQVKDISTPESLCLPYLKFRWYPLRSLCDVTNLWCGSAVAPSKPIVHNTDEPTEAGKTIVTGGRRVRSVGWLPRGTGFHWGRGNKTLGYTVGTRLTLVTLAYSHIHLTLDSLSLQWDTGKKVLLSLKHSILIFHKPPSRGIHFF